MSSRYSIRDTVGVMDEVFPAAYRVTELAVRSVGRATQAVAEFDRLRTGRQQEVAVDPLHAAIAFRSERHLLVDGEPPSSVTALVPMLRAHLALLVDHDPERARTDSERAITLARDRPPTPPGARNQRV